LCPKAAVEGCEYGAVRTARHDLAAPREPVANFFMAIELGVRNDGVAMRVGDGLLCAGLDYGRQKRVTKFNSAARRTPNALPVRPPMRESRQGRAEPFRWQGG